MQQMNLFGGSDNIDQTPLHYLQCQPIPNPDSPVIVSYGGGKNSTALLILCKKLGIKVDLVLFADTGGELPETYEFMEIFNTWLTNNKMPEITIVKRLPVKPSKKRKTYVYAINSLKNFIMRGDTKLLTFLIWWVFVTGSVYTTLEEACVTTNSLPSKAFGSSACSVTWKIEPQEAFVDRWDNAKKAWGNGIKVRRLIGYHAKELSRLIDKKTGVFRSLETDKYINEYPLILHGLDDVACSMLIASEGLPIPPKSSCFFCPNRKISEIQRLPDNLMMRSILIEQIAANGIHKRENTSIKGLGRSFKWAELSKITPLEATIIDIQKQSKSCHCVD